MAIDKEEPLERWGLEQNAEELFKKDGTLRRQRHETVCAQKDAADADKQSVRAGPSTATTTPLKLSVVQG